MISTSVLLGLGHHSTASALGKYVSETESIYAIEHVGDGFAIPFSKDISIESNRQVRRYFNEVVEC